MPPTLFMKGCRMSRGPPDFASGAFGLWEPAFPQLLLSWHAGRRRAASTDSPRHDHSTLKSLCGRFFFFFFFYPSSVHRRRALAGPPIHLSYCMFAVAASRPAAATRSRPVRAAHINGGLNALRRGP